MKNTSGFYKQTEDGWLYAPNFVESPTCTLVVDYKDTYEYPIDGWIWYDKAPAEYIMWEYEQNNLDNGNND
jgi:hypothetical protein